MKIIIHQQRGCENCFENKVWVEAVKGNYVLSQKQFDDYLDKFTNHCLTQGKTAYMSCRLQETLYLLV